MSPIPPATKPPAASRTIAIKPPTETLHKFHKKKKLGPTSPTIQKEKETGPARSTTKSIIFNKADNCFDAMGLSYMAQLRRQKAVESENDDVHRRAQNK